MGEHTKRKSGLKRRYSRNTASQPRELKIHGKWYRWNALGTEGDTLYDVDITGYEKYFITGETE